MARRRFQNPTPFREGKFWYLRLWDAGLAGNRKRQRIKLAPANMPMREVQKIAEEKLLPVNCGLVTATSAINFKSYVETAYRAVLPSLSTTTQQSYAGMISKYLEPSFGRLCLRELSPSVIQNYFSQLAGKVNYPTILKIRDALSSILRYAVEKEFLVRNPLENLRLPKDKRARRPKPTLTPEQFNALMELITEPYATMVYTAIWTGLRVSEVIALKWRCIHEDSISVEERFTRGDWSEPKTDASAATIGVEPHVIDHIERLKTLSVDIKAGCAVRKYRVVKDSNPDALVFQSVKDGKPMNDQNILKRHIQPAARRLGLSFVNWRCLRTSHATWLVQAGADPKSVQGQMRHSRVSTTLDIYSQIVPAAQRRALRQLSAFAKASGPIAGPELVQ